jgi:hypothetical protein
MRRKLKQMAEIFGPSVYIPIAGCIHFFMANPDTVINVDIARKICGCGDEVRGTVTFRPSHANEKLSFEVYGRESVAWTETTSYSVQGLNQTYFEEFKEENRLFHSTSPVHLPTELDLSQTYRIGFSFQLPSSLPGSCIESNGFGTTYRVRAYTSIDHVKSMADIHVIQQNIGHPTQRQETPHLLHRIRLQLHFHVRIGRL